jgi:hypothetical protein
MMMYHIVLADAQLLRNSTLTMTGIISCETSEELIGRHERACGFCQKSRMINHDVNIKIRSCITQDSSYKMHTVVTVISHCDTIQA